MSRPEIQPSFEDRKVINFRMTFMRRDDTPEKILAQLKPPRVFSSVDVLVEMATIVLAYLFTT